MIISNKYKYIFIAIPRTASNSIRTLLRQRFDSAEDWEQVTLFSKTIKKLPFKELNEETHGHVSYRELQEHVDPKQFYTFAVVRNPYDRFVSSCFFFLRKSGLRDYEKSTIIYNTNLMKHGILFKPQHTFICGKGGRIKVDKVIRFEDLGAGLQEVCSKIGIEYNMPDVINKTKDDKELELFFRPKIKELVYQQYKKDFEIFGYDPTII
jgi:hypothetical protein